MGAADWAQAAIKAAADIAAKADQLEFAGTPAELLGRMLVLLGRAAGHADRLSLQGRAGQQARHHFQAEMSEAGACALVLLAESRRRQQQPPRTSQQIVDAIVQGQVLAGRQLQAEGAPAPGHAAGGLGAAIVAVGAALPTVPLDDEHLPAQLDEVLESVLGHAIAAVARV
jgi:hypothetical protein